MRVLNTTRVNTRKKERASSASLERWKERNMTSIVSKIVFEYLNGLKTRRRRNVRRIENRKKAD